MEGLITKAPTDSTSNTTTGQAMAGRLLGVDRQMDR